VIDRVIDPIPLHLTDLDELRIVQFTIGLQPVGCGEGDNHQNERYRCAGDSDLASFRLSHGTRRSLLQSARIYEPKKEYAIAKRDAYRRNSSVVPVHARRISVRSYRFGVRTVERAAWRAFHVRL